MTDLVLERFWDKVEVDNITKCWNWKAFKNQKGYGQFWDSENYKLVASHRFAYEVNKGKIPDILTIDHLCRNRACCNPEHMEAVTIEENQSRGNILVHQNRIKTHCKRGHELIGDNLVRHKLKYNERCCKICTKEITRKSLLKRKLSNKITWSN